MTDLMYRKSICVNIIKINDHKLNFFGLFLVESNFDFCGDNSNSNKIHFLQDKTCLQSFDLVVLLQYFLVLPLICKTSIKIVSFT